MRKIHIAQIVFFLIFIGLCFCPPFIQKFFLAGLSLSIFFLLLAISVSQSIVKYACIILFSLCLPLSLFEGYSSILMQKYTGSHRQTIFTEINGKTRSKKHADIGYVALPNNTVTVTAMQEETLLYKATYTTDGDGRRITPQNPQAKTAILLFGCSFTFGEGLNDTQVMAWKLGEILGENYQVFNFGYSGYGPHNALAIIEHTLPDLQKFDRILTYFIVIPDHIIRVAGLTSGDGPRYELEKGTLVRRGTFADIPPLPWEKDSWKWLQQSALFTFYRKPIAEKFLPYNTDAKRMELLRTILTTGAKKLHSRYAQNSSSVLTWPVGSSSLATKLAPLDDHLPIIDMKAWLPKYNENSAIYTIPIDNHPNALANELMAKNLAKLVQEQEKK